MGKAVGPTPATGGKTDAFCPQVGGLPRRRMKRLLMAVVAVFAFAQLVRLNMQIRGNSYSLYVNTYEAESLTENGDSEDNTETYSDVQDPDEPIPPVREIKTREPVRRRVWVRRKSAEKAARSRTVPVKSTAAKVTYITAIQTTTTTTTPSPPSPRTKVKHVKTSTGDIKLTSVVVKKKKKKMKKCPLVSPKLVGIVKPELQPPTLKQQEHLYPELKPGGHYTPTECIPVHRVAIIIPYRDRELHLTTLLYHLHPILQRQQIDYTVFVVEQAGTGMFNRGMLKNIGVLEAIRRRRYTCLIFHDVDLMVENDLNPYTCFSQPHHMSVGVDTMGYKLPYKDLFGGVASVEVVPFLRVNGFSNMYWGWGAEDDDLAWRLRNKGYTIIRFSTILSRYSMLAHAKDTPNPTRHRFLNNAKNRYKKDGLNSVRYRLLDMQKHPLYTWLYVELFPS